MIDSVISAAIRGLLSAAGTGMIVSWAWLVHKLSTRQPLLPGRLVDRSPVPPWGSLTVLGAFLAYVLVSLTLSELYHAAIPRSQAPAPAPAIHPVPEIHPNPDAHPGAGEPAAESVSQREQMGLAAAVDLVLLLMLPIVSRWSSGARARDFGASWANWQRQAVLGFGAAFVMIPVCFAIQGLAVRVWASNEHKLATLLRDQFSPGTAVLALLTAVVLAPAVEELLFRALVQRWLIGLFHELARILDPFTVVEAIRDPLATAPAVPSALEADSAGLVSPLAWSRPTWLGILVTSLIFAAVHAPQWPAPISLFVFAVALGVVHQRTGSLMAVIIMHATLNAISTLVMILMAMHGA